MKFGSCRAANGGFLIDTFSKEYNKTTFEKSEFADKSAAADLFKNFDYISSCLCVLLVRTPSPPSTRRIFTHLS